jgi:hypothetical protein
LFKKGYDKIFFNKRKGRNMHFKIKFGSFIIVGILLMNILNCGGDLTVLQSGRYYCTGGQHKTKSTVVFDMSKHTWYGSDGDHTQAVLEDDDPRVMVLERDENTKSYKLYYSPDKSEIGYLYVNGTRFYITGGKRTKFFNCIKQ